MTEQRINHSRKRQAGIHSNAALRLTVKPRGTSPHEASCSSDVALVSLAALSKQ